MIKLKAALKWLKENIWIPLSAAVVLLLSLLLFRKNNRQLLSTLEQNRILQNEELKAVKEIDEQLAKKADEVKNKTKEKVKKLKIGRAKRAHKHQQDLKNRIDELASKSNDELAELMKKDNEI